MRRTIWVSAFALISAGALEAASVSGISGDVAVNQGDGFRAVTAPTIVSPGDVVMASPGGSASIVYDNGCVEAVAAGQTAVVSQDPKCENTALDTGLLTIGAVAAVAGGIAYVVSEGSDSGGSGGGGGGGGPASP